MGLGAVVTFANRAIQSDALVVELEASRRREDNLKNEIIALQKEDKELLVENELLRKEKEAYKWKPMLVDIGPCAIKQHKGQAPLHGFYCNTCGEILCKDLYISQKDAFHCQRCKIGVLHSDIQIAIKDYVSRTDSDGLC